MDVTYIAQIFGPILILTGIYAVFLRHECEKACDDFHANGALMWMEAFISLVIGLAIVNVYSEWTPSWRVLVTVFGWIVVIRGFLSLFFPKQFCEWFKRHHANLIVVGVLRIFFGVVFMFLGYF
ncbi:MAG: hypothetical protein K9M07_01025 [Simkaniaceae bacterium]|nr:hypothetical protein [Simkaniaceae bacterium]